ncbi:glycosyltransferase family 4 protein [Pseudomarimonas arenosa]|uniref:Glycosyltransferase family 4 protein n=1 Tax=Pseudomarimonas arenosa TaxID=2774145 RepID=A0AAW3ZIS9_9GAMM|nr:glycosyltransferase family 4 protein [Pseudomarimonas arenosa]MBD8524845.1 glycosyltransferase family 4 protein [Pseudomarimonas arenosa]
MSGNPPTRPTRVLYVVSLFPCWSETFIVREIEQLIAAGVDVRILSLKPPSESMVQAGAQALMPRVIGPGLGPRGWWAALRQAVSQPMQLLTVLTSMLAGLWRQPAVLGKTLIGLMRSLAVLDALRAFNPQWIHAHWATYPSSAAWMLGRLLRLPFSFTSHAHDIFVEDQMLARKLADARLAITISDYNVGYLKRWSQPHGAPNYTRMRVVHCGVDLTEIAYTPDGRDPLLIATVGRMDPIKGFAVLIEALGRLRSHNIPFRCRLIGEGELRPELEAARRKLGLDDALEMPGARPQEAVRALLAEAAIFVMPSVTTPAGNQDGIPVALMEAMASGAAAVSTRVSGIPELVEHDRTGLLVDPHDVDGLAQALQRLLQDATLRRRLSDAARQRVEQQFDAATEAGKLLRHWQTALSGAEQVNAR